MALLAVLTALLAMGASGCLFKPVESLYALPILPEEYSALQTTIQATMDELGAEYATINYGANTSTVQLLDLDGDGAQETAAVFLRVAAEEKPLRVCLFLKGSDGTYQRAYMVGGDGTSINSVAYEDLTGNGVRELIVSWQMSAKVHILSAYQLTSAGASELMNTTYNDSYLITDLEAGGGKELLVFQQNSTGEGISQAEYYRYQDGVMAMASTAQLSNIIQDVTSAVNGALTDGTRCVYATSAIESGVLTDILYLDENGLHNATRDPESGVSSATIRTYTDVGATDINGDGVLEIPLPVQAPNLDPALPPSYYVIYWRQFDRNGSAAVSCATYHSTSDGWYLMLPDSWSGNITVGRDDSLSGRGERSVVFYYWPYPDSSEPEPFLTIYRLTGNNRETRAKLSGRFTLYSDSSTIYAASLDETVWDCGVTAEELAQRFHLITVAWSSQ